MSTGVVIKLALIPDVEDVILDQNNGERTVVTVEVREGTRETQRDGANTSRTVEVGEGTGYTEPAGTDTPRTVEVGEGTRDTEPAGTNTPRTVEVEVTRDPEQAGTNTPRTVEVEVTRDPEQARTNTPRTVEVEVTRDPEQAGTNTPRTVEVEVTRDPEQAGTNTPRTVEVGEGTGDTVQDEAIITSRTVEVRKSTVTQEGGEDARGTGRTSVDTTNPVEIRAGNVVTIKAGESTTVKVQGGEGTAVKVQGGEGTAVTVQGGEGTAVTVQGGEGTAVTVQGGEGTAGWDVFFQTYSGCKTLHFWVDPFILPFILGSGMLLVMSYGAVFITSHWKITRNCNNSNEFGIRMSCYRLNLCPPVNCATWNNRSAWINNATWNNSANWMENQSSENLFCLSLSPDVVNTLVNFVSIYAVQVALMQLFACIVNKGCCLPFRYPPCRYTTICIMNFVFFILVLALTVAAWATVLQGGTIFQTLAIPLFHLLFVLLSVCAIQSTLAASMWLTGPKETEEKQKLKDLFCFCRRRQQNGDNMAPVPT